MNRGVSLNQSIINRLNPYYKGLITQMVKNLKLLNWLNGNHIAVTEEKTIPTILIELFFKPDHTVFFSCDVGAFTNIHDIQTRKNNLWIAQKVASSGNRNRYTLHANRLHSHRAN
ncbi:hypothetical protein SFRURICE_014913 [Spodoptera frugiperda]|nr:hypothetical protein SFRURICE_014913 [Spodoptera frugiperda]